MTLHARDARQRYLIAKKGMANREMRNKKLARDRAVAELVYGRIFMRTGGVVRAWTVIIANVNRLRFLVSLLYLCRARLVSLKQLCPWHI